MRKSIPVKKNYIHNRSIRWTFVNFILASSPILFSIVISLVFELIDWESIIGQSFLEGTVLIIAVSLAGNQYVTFTYSREFDKLDAKTSARINIGFLIIATMSTLVFTVIKLGESIQEVISTTLDPFPITVISLSILVFSFYYTYEAQRIKLYYDRIHNNAKIPLLDNDEDKDFSILMEEEKVKILEIIKKENS